MQRALGLGSLLACITLCACTDSSAEESDSVAESDETRGGDGDGDGDASGDGDGDGDGNACSGPWEAGFALEMPTLPAGDPAAGYEALLTQPYVSCGIPWEFFSLAENALGVEEPLPGREGKNAMVGHSWTVVTNPDGSEMVVQNCLECHAGRFNGELIVGLGKADADFTTPFSDFADPLPDLPETNDAYVAFNKLKSRASALGPFSTMATIGANPAVMFAIVLLSHRDPTTLAWSDEPYFEVHEDMVLPADPPPWWRVAKKATHFANGMSRGDHRGTMALASSVCADSPEETQPVLDYFVDIQAYLASLEAPEYPFAIDQDLAAEGQVLFECSCEGCHGSYADDPAEESFPNLLIPTEVIGTDPAFANQASDGGTYNYLQDWFNESIYGTVSEVVTSDPAAGYTAPPLDGIWATAPFFHNGSVPSIELVLDSSARPNYWRRVDYDSTNFDEATLGWPWTETLAQADTSEGQRKFVYDTTLFGYGNQGHTFGDHFSPAERAAVLEYLKTL